MRTPTFTDPSVFEDGIRSHKVLASRDQWISALLVALVALSLPVVLESSLFANSSLPTAAILSAVVLALIASVGAAAFNLLVGYAGQISLAHAAFLMLGTSVAGYLGAEKAWPILLVLPVVAVAGAVVGVLVALPALRLRGLYLLLVTLGVHYLASALYRWWLGEQFGFLGIVFPQVSLGGFALDNDRSWYWASLAFATICVYVMARYVRTPQGTALLAIHARDQAAALIGIPVARSKAVVFAISSAFVALSGALSGYYLGARGEDSFPLGLVLSFAVMIVVGGFSSIQGGVLGAFFYYLVPITIDWLLTVTPGLSDVQVLKDYSAQIDLALFGVLIVVILIYRPDGLSGLWRRAKSSLVRRVLSHD